MAEALAQRRRGGGNGSGSMLAARLWWRRVEDTGGNSDGVGTDNNQQGCGSGVGSGRLPPLFLFPSSLSSLSSLPFPSLLQLLF
jgi:hypothetical protein